MGNMHMTSASALGDCIVSVLRVGAMPNVEEWEVKFACEITPCMYREPLKGSSQVGRICGGKIVSFCLQQLNKTQLSYLVSHNLGRAL